MVEALEKLEGSSREEDWCAPIASTPILGDSEGWLNTLNGRYGKVLKVLVVGW